MNQQRSFQKTMGLTLVLLFAFACSTLKPEQTPTTNPTIPKAGHWEGSNPVVSFDITSEGKIINLTISIPYGGSTCNISIAAVAIQPDYTMALDLTSTETLSIGYVNGIFHNVEMSGKYLIKMCGQSISFIPGEDKDRDWSATWKNSSVTSNPTSAPVMPTFTSIPILPTLTSTPTQFNINVPANEVWLNTGVYLAAGQTLIISASGKVNTNGGKASGNTLSPDGQANNPPCYTIDSDCLMPGVFCGTLIGRIGNGVPFKVGSQFEMLISSDGTLYLAVNDNAGYFKDNSGAFSVIITVR